MTLLCSRVDTLYCSLQWINKRYESVTQSIVHIVMDGVDFGSDAGGDGAEEREIAPFRISTNPPIHNTCG